MRASAATSTSTASISGVALTTRDDLDALAEVDVAAAIAAGRLRAVNAHALSCRDDFSDADVGPDHERIVRHAAQRDVDARFIVARR